MESTLYALVLALWTTVAPGLARLPQAPRIARTIASLVSEDPLPPVYGDKPHDAAMMAYFALRESTLQETAVGDGGRSFGVWQMRYACAHVPLEQQGACWLWRLHEGARTCPAHPVAVMWGSCVAEFLPLAAQRERRVEKLLAVLNPA